VAKALAELTGDAGPVNRRDQRDYRLAEWPKLFQTRSLIG
jgi:hypothetical protein